MTWNLGMAVGDGRNSFVASDTDETGVAQLLGTSCAQAACAEHPLGLTRDDLAGFWLLTAPGSTAWR